MSVPVLVLALSLLASAPVALAATVREAGQQYAAVAGCGDKDRLCVVFPDDCTVTNSCTLMVTARQDPVNDTQYLFEMSAQYTAWVGVALAASSSMGNDSVVECTYGPDVQQVRLFQSLNYDKKPSTGRKGNARLPSDAQKGVSLVSGTMENGVISCSFRRDRETTVNGVKYDLASGSWYIQAAAGSRFNADSSIHHHDAYVGTTGAYKLSAVGILESDGQAKEHGKGSASATHATAVSTLAALWLWLWLWARDL